jgi:TonB family protein
MALAFSPISYAQESAPNELRYAVNIIYSPLSMTRETLKKAHVLLDLNKYYKPSWVKEYISVEILATYKGNQKKAVSKNNILSQEQKEIMNMADVGTEILVNIHYVPDNTLKNNDIKETGFSFIVNPDIEAKYSNKEQELKEYLKDNAINKITEGSFNSSSLAAVKFTINEKGQVVDAQVLETSKDEGIDQLLLAAIREMSNWTPAEYSNGTKVKQEFVLTVGNMESCVMNLLNIRRN